MKVRFAPSPTGFMHIGNTRTALFNWLLAKKMGGEFMLRIDDTDTLRSKKEYEDGIRDALEWLHLEWKDEARQSARVERYREVTEKLKQEGRIYACYETPEELEFMRKRLLNKGLPPIYDRSALTLTQAQIEKYKAEGRRPHYRFKLVEGEIVWNDLVRGECRYSEKNLSDPVIIRADGSFLYHLPSVIDDSDFGISHIVRGEDHVTNTASQIQMFEAIGGKVPAFAHLPLLTGKEGKLSKRLGSLGVKELRAEGVEAMSICSFLAKLGTSEAITPYYSLEELSQTLDFSKIGHSQPKFDEEELKKFNTHLVHNLPYEQIKTRYGISQELWNAVKGNITIADDVLVWKRICEEKIAPQIDSSARELLKAAIALLPEEPWGEQTFNEWVEKIKQQTGKKGKELFHPLRLALTGAENGPELKVLLPLMGRTKVLARLKGEEA